MPSWKRDPTIVIPLLFGVVLLGAALLGSSRPEPAPPVRECLVPLIADKYVVFADRCEPSASFRVRVNDLP